MKTTSKDITLLLYKKIKNKTMSPTGEYHYFYCQIKELYLKLRYDWNEDDFKYFILFQKFVNTETYHNILLTNYLLVEDEVTMPEKDYIDNLYIFSHINGIDIDDIISP